MDKKIIIAADEAIVCPACSHQFALDQGITRHTIEGYESEFAASLAAHRRELEQSLEKEAERKATKLYADQLNRLKDDLATVRQAEQEARAQIAQAQAAANARAQAEFAQERAHLTATLAEKDTQLNSFRQQELDLRRQKQQLEQQQAGLELELERKLDEERRRLAIQIQEREATRFSLIEAEYKKKIEDAQRANDDLRRKLDQGSQQLQGEVLELELEHTLRTAFRHDAIDEVKKGQRGADVIQSVRTPSGIQCGKIIWEAKRAEHWSDKWLQKLKDDQQAAQAEIAVLVTTAMPRDAQEGFCRIGDIWVVTPALMRPLGETLRVILLEAQRLKQINSGRSEKIEQLYNYVAGPQFYQRVRSMLDSFESMRNDLEAEKRAMQKIWTKRQAQLERITLNLTHVVGELQAIAEDELPQLEAVLTLEAITHGAMEELA